MLEEKFQKLKKRWIKETMFMSSTTDIVYNKHYQSIIKMGEKVVPIILKDMKDEPNWWFWALASITEEDPTTVDICGDLQKLTQVWLKWGEQNGYL